MGFEADMKAAMQYLTMQERFIDPKAPQGLWFCANVLEVSDISLNAVCLPSQDWDDVVKCRAFLSVFPYIVIATPNAIARQELAENLRPRLPAMCIYVTTDVGWRGCKTTTEFIETHGRSEILDVLNGAEELPAFGLLDLSKVQRRDMSKVPRTLSRFPRLDTGIGGFFAGELSVWTGKRGSGKSTILSQMLLEAIDQGHTVCAYSGELPKEQFREWAYLQAAGPGHVVYQKDPLTGKRLASADALAERYITEWLQERFWLFDLECNTRHDPAAILSQFEYAHMRYGADVFLVDNIMSVELDGHREQDFYRLQSKFTQMLVTFSKRRRVHTHLVVHPRKSSDADPGKVTSDDVGGSGDITNRADNVFFLTMHSASSTGADGGKYVQKPLLKILKNRDFGARGEIWLDFDKKSRRYFQDRTCNAERPYGWDPSANQLLLQNSIPTPAPDEEAPEAEAQESTFREVTGEEVGKDIPF